MQTTPETPSGERSRRRRNVVSSSPHYAEYRRLMEAGWSSLALERYAWYRYEEDIPASTFRSFKSRSKIKAKVRPTPYAEGQPIDREQLVDVLSARMELIQLQQERIAIDVKHERSMGKLFATGRQEIALLNDLLESSKGDLQDLGVFPRVGDKVEVTTREAESPEDAPRARTLAEALGMPDADPAELAKVVYLDVRKSGNGQ